MQCLALDLERMGINGGKKDRCTIRQMYGRVVAACVVKEYGVIDWENQA